MLVAEIALGALADLERSVSPLIPLPWQEVHHDAEFQKSELVVASMSEGFPWSTWLAWGFGAVVVISSVVLWIQRRGH